MQLCWAQFFEGYLPHAQTTMCMQVCSGSLASHNIGLAAMAAALCSVWVTDGSLRLACAFQLRSF